MDKHRIALHLRQQIPRIMAIYAFGSCINGTATADSDLDLAVLVEGYADPVALFDLSGELADMVGRDVDLMDLRAASTVMQHQVLTTGECWWSCGMAADLFAAAMLSEMTELNRARAPLLRDIQQRGTIYGR